MGAALLLTGQTHREHCMDIIWRILLQFIFRLSMGIAAAMGLTSPRWVNAGFFRVHLWVIMGGNTLAALVAWSRPHDWTPRVLITSLAVALTVLAYFGAVVWLYEQHRWGRWMLWGVAGLAFIAATAMFEAGLTAPMLTSLKVLDIVSSGLLLGSTITAMFLGHWYLNHPGMELAPLRRLVLLMAASVILRSVAAGIGLGMEISAVEKATAWWLMILLRWCAGLGLTFVLAWLTWQTLKVPNTQSATGILYAAVILTFIGELTSQLLSADAAYPL